MDRILCAVSKQTPKKLHLEISKSICECDLNKLDTCRGFSTKMQINDLCLFKNNSMQTYLHTKQN